MDRIPLFPLDVVVFPGEPFGLHLFEERYLLMAEDVLEKELPIGIVLAKQDEDEEVIEHAPEGPVGTAVLVSHAERIEERWNLETIGARRFVIHEVLSKKPYQEALVTWLEEKPGDGEYAQELASDLLTHIESLGAHVDWDSASATDPVAVSHAVAASVPFDLFTKQRLLEAESAVDRLDAEMGLLRA